MFSQLKDVVDLVRTGITDFRKFKLKRQREKVLVDILKFYFLLKDCVDEGEQLIEEAGSDPVAKIRAMQGNEAITTLARWDFVLRRQGMRLYALKGYVFGAPQLQDSLKKVIGYKMQRAVTLHGIGSTLFLRYMFPIEDTNEERARLVALMVGARSKGTLDLKKVRREIASLRGSLDEYRSVVQRLVTDEELLQFSSRARDESLFRD
jgi:hypothetical protein